MSENSKLLSRQIIESLRKGSVPTYGASRFYHCRRVIRRIIDEDLSFTRSGGYSTKFFCGRYGSGKTLTLGVIRDKGHDLNFATSLVTLDPRATTFHKLEVIYRSVLDSMSIVIDGEIKESGEAVSSILYHWGRKYHLSRSRPVFPETPGLTDILRVFVEKPNLRSHIVEWLMGARHIPFTIKRRFDVKGDIGHSSCMSFLKAFCRILVKIGYSGLVILLDEAESIMSLWTRTSRDVAYDNIRNLIDNRYRMRNLYIAFGGTPEFFSNPDRGIPSFPALNERISHYWKEIKRSYRSPILMLYPPKKKDYFSVLRRVSNIYSKAYDCSIYLTDDIVSKYLKASLKESTTPREVIRGFVAYLDQRAEQMFGLG